MTLPNFIISGAPKAGTTSLYRYLAEHPGVYMSPVKEPDFFHLHYDRGLEWYASLFEGRVSEEAIGEASPDTMASIEAMERIHSIVPEMRFIYIVRDPIDRAYSHYLFEVNMGTQSALVKFSEFIRDEENARRNKVVDLGMYSKHIENCMKYFDRGQIFVGLFDDLKSDRKGFLRSVYDFLGLEEYWSDEEGLGNVYNVTYYPRSLAGYRFVRSLWDPIKARMSERTLQKIAPIKDFVHSSFFTANRNKRPRINDEDIEYLYDIYRDSNKDLERLLGRDLSAWHGMS